MCFSATASFSAAGIPGAGGRGHPFQASCLKGVAAGFAAASAILVAYFYSPAKNACAMGDHAVILDNRFNDGGDYTNLASFGGNLPKHTSGKIIILTSPMTFSAGITTVGFVKQAGGDRVTLVGEKVGDRMAFYSEGARGCLPNYHLCLNYRTAKHDYARACTDLRSCFWLDWFYPVQVKSFDPDETVTMSFADWRSGHDPIYARALALAKS